MNRADAQTLAAEQDAAAIIVSKSHWLWTALWVGFILITLGLGAIGMSRRRFIEEFATTIGPWVGIPEGWLRTDSASPSVIVHESGGHVKQFAFAGWFIPIIGWFFGRKVRAAAGALPMLLVYGVVVFPIGLAICRLLLEIDAEKAAWRWELKQGASAEGVLLRARDFGETVCGPAYLWSWPRFLGGVALFERAARGVIKEALT